MILFHPTDTITNEYKCKHRDALFEYVNKYTLKIHFSGVMGQSFAFLFLGPFRCLLSDLLQLHLILMAISLILSLIITINGRCKCRKYNQICLSQNTSQETPANNVIVLYLSLDGAKIILLQFASNNYLIADDLATCVFYDEIRIEVLLLKHSLSFVSFTNQNVIRNYIHGMIVDNYIEHETQSINKCIKGTNTVINEYIKYQCEGIDICHDNKCNSLNNAHMAMINGKIVITTTTSAVPIAYKHIMEGIAYPTDGLLSVWNNKIIKTKNIIAKATDSQIKLHLKTFDNNTYNFTSSYILPISVLLLVNIGINCTGSMCNK